MKPSTNLFALIRAYDLRTQPAKTLQEYRQQSQQFIDEIELTVKAVESIFPHRSSGDCRMQNHFDALVSIAYDLGSDLFFATGIPETFASHASNATMKRIILRTPCFANTLRPELAEAMKNLKIKPMDRRELDYMLYCGHPYFTIGRTRQGDETVFAPSVLHPVYSFLLALSNK